MKVNYATISKTGRRSNNEDGFCVIDEKENGRWFGIVCDGMGGHAMGEVVSDTVVKAIPNYWGTHKTTKDSKRKVGYARIRDDKPSEGTLDVIDFLGEKNGQTGTGDFCP